jgi:hypothetical protein
LMNPPEGVVINYNKTTKKWLLDIN